LRERDLVSIRGDILTGMGWGLVSECIGVKVEDSKLYLF